MMRFINNKKNVKIVSLVVAVIFLLGIGAIAYQQMAVPTMAAASSNIGVVDTHKIADQNTPAVAAAMKEDQEFRAQLQKDYAAQSANMDDQQKAQLQIEFQKKAQDKSMEIQEKLQKALSDAAQSVADAKGLSVVLNKEAVIYGGVDITDQVKKKLNEGAPTTDTNASQTNKTDAQK
ncbi:MAG: OmpH family outer membrane protein [Veillonella sp.]|uniref:OmpH family outer membrane protein n=1 Tax=Veillonella sp. TaxID=1926307 RepID=UPI0025DAC596|nr:OmpH family outer membrane protein [Veillonella sp.]MBS4913579.1 OmpH family outer membrane protein [Veillonella sp.]